MIPGQALELSLNSEGTVVDSLVEVPVIPFQFLDIVAVNDKPAGSLIGKHNSLKYNFNLIMLISCCINEQ